MTSSEETASALSHGRSGAAQRVVYLARHGQTTLNAQHALRGRLDPPLDRTGVDQAEALAASLHKAGAVAIVSSPLLRARQTADWVAAPFGLPVHIERGLVDRDYGEWAGTAVEEVRHRFGSIDEAPGVEMWPSVCARAVDAVRSIDEHFEAGAVIVVAHDAVNRALLTTLVPSLRSETITQPTGCWNRLERKGRRWSAPVVGAMPCRPDGR